MIVGLSKRKLTAGSFYSLFVRTACSHAPVQETLHTTVLPALNYLDAVVVFAASLLPPVTLTFVTSHDLTFTSSVRAAQLETLKFNFVVSPAV